MASGFAQRGGVSRCFNLYHDLEECVAKADHDIQCLALREDYFECLHRTKQAPRPFSPSPLPLDLPVSTFSHSGSVVCHHTHLCTHARTTLSSTSFHISTFHSLRSLSLPLLPSPFSRTVALPLDSAPFLSSTFLLFSLLFRACSDRRSFCSMRVRSNSPRLFCEPTLSSERAWPGRICEECGACFCVRRCCCACAHAPGL